MVNRHISLWRRHRDRVEVRGVIPGAASPDAGEASADRDEVYRLLRQLPARQRAAVVLRNYADYSDTAIAAVLGCSTSTVRSQISRAFSTLGKRSDRGELPLSVRTSS